MSNWFINNNNKPCESNIKLKTVYSDFFFFLQNLIIKLHHMRDNRTTKAEHQYSLDDTLRGLQSKHWSRVEDRETLTWSDISIILIFSWGECRQVAGHTLEERMSWSDTLGDTGIKMRSVDEKKSNQITKKSMAKTKMMGAKIMTKHYSWR